MIQTSNLMQSNQNAEQQNMLSVDQKHSMVGECLEQLFGGKIQENISDFSVNVQIHIKSVPMRKPGRTSHEVIQLKSPISLKLAIGTNACWFWWVKDYGKNLG